MLAMEGTRRARCDRRGRWPAAVVLRNGALVAAVLAMLYVGSDCIAVKAAGEVTAPSLPTIPLPCEPRDGVVRVSARIRGVVTPRSARVADSSVTTNSGSGADSLVSRNDAPFLSADVRLASHATSSAFGFSRTLDDVTRGARSESPSRALDPAAIARYATKIDDQAVRVDLPADDFADTDPGTLTASMSGLDVDALRSVAGGRLQLITSSGERGRMLAEARLSWVYEYLQTDGGTTAFYAPGEKGIFAVQGLSYGSNWALVGYGFRWELLAGWSAYTHYDAQANMQQMIHIGSAGFAYAW